MMNNFYDDPLNVMKLIGEINSITNSRLEYVKLTNGPAPDCYVNDKSYYFASALSSVLPGSEIYIITRPPHAVVYLNRYYYNANGLYQINTTGSVFPLRLGNNDYIHKSLASDFDDECLLPALIQIAKEADNNIRLNGTKNSYLVREKVI